MHRPGFGDVRWLSPVRPSTVWQTRQMSGRGKRFVAVVMCLAAVAAACGADVGGDPIERLEAMGTLRYVIATPSDGECEALASQDDETLLPLASVFKLYVLGALVEAVSVGAITWDDSVTIRDELDSLGGPTADEEPGSTRSVRELATEMIRVSDNTATDHLMDLIGREAVEQIQLEMGHSAPMVNVPFVTTRELTILLWSESDIGERYRAAGMSERRSILDDEVAGLPLPAIERIETVIPAQYSIGWLGTAGDACRALVWLMEDDEARSFLTDSPRAPNPDLWPVLGFKGGSSNGVATAAWWMQAGDGQAYVAVVSLVNETKLLDLDKVVELMTSLRDKSATLTAE